MKKYLFSFGLASTIFAISVFCLSSRLTAPEHARGPASIYRYSENIRILNSIPILSPIEHPESDEANTANTLIAIFDRFANHNVNSDGSLNRGTHAKGKCFNGLVHLFSSEELKEKFNYDEALIHRLKQGLFSSEGNLPATMRFANADGVGRKQADTVADVRGFSFTMQTPNTIKDYTGEHRQDFMFNSTVPFATGGIHEFLELVKTANIFVYHDLSFLPDVRYLPAIAESLKALQKGNDMGAGTKSYAAQEYWDNLPYSHGLDASSLPNDIVKFKMAPCDGKGTQHLTSTEGLDPDYLQKDIVERANSGNVCFKLQVQFFDGQKLAAANIEGAKANWNITDWVENGGLGWEESVLPFYTVAEISIPFERNHSAEISCTDQYINTRLHSNRANQPLGSIARVRTLVEETSRARRMGDNDPKIPH